MRMDLTVTGYATFADLAEYTHGSAGVIGLQMLPVLGTVGPREEAAPYAAALGEAFQLTNFLRDVGEDLDRGRLYLPADELAAFGVDRATARATRTGPARRSGRSGGRWRTWWRYTQAVYRRAEPGIAMLRRSPGRASRTAAGCTGDILDEIVARDYDVLGRRVVVPTPPQAAARRAGARARGGPSAALSGWPRFPLTRAGTTAPHDSANGHSRW